MIRQALWTFLIIALIGGLLWWFLRGRQDFRKIDRTNPLSGAQVEKGHDTPEINEEQAVIQNANISQDLYCDSDNDCTYYNASECCGWTPVNVARRSLKDHQANTCDQECRIGTPTCIQNQCALVQ